MRHHLLEIDVVECGIETPRCDDEPNCIVWDLRQLCVKKEGNALGPSGTCAGCSRQTRDDLTE